jgi:hypothetical protein
MVFPIFLTIKICSSPACWRKNSCARTLIFGSSLLLPFVKVFPSLFAFLLSVLLPFLLFLTHVVSSLAYPTCLGLKGLDVVVVSIVVDITELLQNIRFTQQMLYFCM